ncbi:hypothetical protein M1O15_24825 [Streptomyces lichenis]|uniref:Uncharacterized protein n=1 Tax=Streptomyces lichenis TaxID=2306967 RepID=A0ABT0IGW2_9ACTN|nr:hypothetical protein [Streptomyces lichenis]
MRCTRTRRVPLDLMREARERSGAGDVDRSVQCQLGAHGDGEHFGLLDDEQEYGTALWLRWRGDGQVAPAVLADCPTAEPGADGKGCSLFARHAAPHTWTEHGDLPSLTT